MTISSTFDTTLEGWTTDNGTETFFPTGGFPGGYVGGVEGAGGVWTYLAPAAFLGDLGSYYGGTLAFDMIQPSSASQFDDADVQLTGGGITIVIDAGDNPGTSWTEYNLDLELGAGWRVGSLTGAIASESTIRTVLENLTEFSIRGEFVSGTTNDASGLDNVVLEEGPVDPGSGIGGIVSSTFDTDIDGWSFIADVREFNQVATGGNPGGYLEAIDFATGGNWYYVAPVKFLGDKSAFYGGTLSYDLQQSSLSSQFDNDDIIMTGAGITLALDLTHPGTTWTSYDVALSTDADWRIGNEDGVVATQAQIQAVLADLGSLHIRGEFVNGADTGGLDNVVMQADTNVTLYQPANPGSPIGFITLEAAIAAADSGAAITIDAPAIPRDTSGNVLVDVNDLLITGVAGYSETLALSGSANILTLGGAAELDVVGGTGADVVTGNDAANDLSGGIGDDTLEGGAGADLLEGDDGNDVLRGDSGADNLRGDVGNDVISGGTGNDVLNGGDGNDLMFGGADNDLLFGGSGTDKLYGGSGFDRIFGGNDNDIANGGGDNDIINTGGGNDLVFGQSGNDLVFLQAGNDKAFGGDGNDKVFGGDGNDQINLGDGNDEAFGGAGIDVITGAGGNDIMSGGGDADRFVFAANQGNDRITDLAEIDLIDISAFGVTNGGASDQDWRDATTSVVTSGGGNNVTIAWDGGGTLVLEAIGIPSLTDSDFVF